MVTENEGNNDPELIEFEKLKVKVIFGEPNAEAEMKEFLTNKPYLKKYAEYEDNRSMKQFWI